ncbi:helix-turn-helix domain-containing protein [Autumnicola edwardsiae]|uniref:AraC family transcriptional regulator n=1 Tax=Autumnicola edwardsiae TaxID=3075594 RepID=A0ABU3CWX1_9FLAO|nr:AraC family transcriptional regulator [Zunongwangia sp. F297]MDT0650806.1 AraC family transcriptional regulator [Zunongwangia sp. F297]|tara:strand:+ start:10544 stop:11455 length:912 start_codon:yes stop_codon:yes gene_type:complete
MEREFNRANLRGIYRMLTEIAKGNFAFQIKRTHHRDELEGLNAYANQTSEELYRKRHQFLWLNRNTEAMVIRTANFLLDKNLRVMDYSYKHPDNIEVAENNILGKAFSELLVRKFQHTWEKKILKFMAGKEQSFDIRLEYHFDELLKINLHTVVSRLTGVLEEKYIVTSYLMDGSKDFFSELPENSEIKTFSKWDQKLFHEIHIYIIHHLDEPPKTLDQLAMLFNTNEYKIKTGFKEIFGCTPTQYYNKQRIRECKILIENTSLSLTEISIKMGFSSYPHFSKSFKKETHVTPRFYKKITRNS